MTLEARIAKLEEENRLFASLLGLHKKPVKSKRAQKRRAERDAITQSILKSK